MATTSASPPPAGSNLKFVAIGLIFLLSAGGLWMVAGREEPAPATAAMRTPTGPARANPMAEQDLVLEEPVPEPDAAVVAEPDKGPAKKPASGPRTEEWDCAGDLKGAATVINEQRAQVRACYERRLKVNNILQGDLRVKLKVGANGKVLTSNVTGSLNDAEVNTCVRKLAAQWEFEAPSGGSCAVLQVPFQFSPKN